MAIEAIAVSKKLSSMSAAPITQALSKGPAPQNMSEDVIHSHFKKFYEMKKDDHKADLAKSRKEIDNMVLQNTQELQKLRTECASFVGEKYVYS